MDPISALGIAGNIVQFVDFGIRVVSKSCHIYRSADGRLSEDLDLEVVTSDLLVLQSRLQMPLQCSTANAGTESQIIDDAQALQALCEACAKLSVNLLEKLNMAKAQGRYRKWKSLRQALKSVWSKEDVNNMRRNLEEFQNQLSLRILVSLRDQFDFNSTQISRISHQLDQSSQSILTALQNNKDVFEASLTKSIENINKPLDDKANAPQIYIQDSRGVPSRECEVLPDHNPGSQLDFWTTEAILSSLSYEGMDDRFATVPQAHRDTFSWIFQRSSDQNWDSYVDWLERGSQIYWINGKAASGKSTLMRHIFTSRQLDYHLSKWDGGGEAPLLKAHFYFWATGTQIQKSQVGLFRSLLHQLLRDQPRLIPAVCPAIYKEIKTFKPELIESLSRRPGWRSWSLSKLKQTFETLLRLTSLSKVFLLIDGLDEFSGDYGELASFFKEVVRIPHVKVCVSSRPMLAYEQSFDLYPKLRLQDLTINDINKVVTDRLMSHPRFCFLKREESDTSLDFIQEIVHMSAGVFLWVALVVKSILEGLTNHDRISDLQRRLRELPPELDDLYSLMLGSVKPAFYLAQASRLLQIVYHTPSPLRALVLSFADDEDTTFALKARFNFLTSTELRDRVREISLRLKSRCAGLLEVRETEASRPLLRYDEGETAWSIKRATEQDFTVRYLHLTVREFLEKPEVWTKLLALTKPENFDASSSLLRAHILMLKSGFCYYNAPLPQHVLENGGVRSEVWSQYMPIIEDTMRLARRTEDSTGTSPVAILDELDTVAGILRPRSFSRHWSSIMHSEEQPCQQCPDSFLNYAVTYGLTLYVKNRLGQPGVRQSLKNQRSLLDYATWYHPWYVRIPLAQPAMVSMLLKEGFLPNNPSGGFTPWRSIIRYMGRKEEESSTIDSPPCFDLLWADTCKLLIMAGADLRVYYKSKSTTKTLEEVLENAFRHLPPGPLDELRQMIQQRKPSETSSSFTTVNTFRERRGPRGEQRRDWRQDHVRDRRDNRRFFYGHDRYENQRDYHYQQDSRYSRRRQLELWDAGDKKHYRSPGRYKPY